MIQKIDACLKERGYSFIKVSPEEVGVYYRFTEGRAQVVAGIFMHPGFVLETEKLQAIQKKLQELFLHPEGRIPGCEQNMAIYQVELLTLLVADDIGQARMLSGSCRNVWLINEQTGQLMIFENQPGDFYGLRDALQEQISGGGRQRGYASQGYAQMDNYRRTEEKRGLTLWQRIKQYPSWCNAGIVLINIIVFLALSALGDTESAAFMEQHGAVFLPDVFGQGEWWRLFTAMFLHFGLAHLANNMIVLFWTGDRLERLIGKWRYLIIYFGAGLCGNLLSLLVTQGKGTLTVSAGASGAIFGVFGALLWVIIANRGRVEELNIRGIIIMIALSLYYGFTSTGVDNWCHVGGLISGFFLSLLLYRRKD